MSPLRLVRVSILGVPLLMAISAMGFVPALALDPTLAIEKASSLPVETVQETGPIDDALSLVGAPNPDGGFLVEPGIDTVEDLPVAGFVPAEGEDSTSESSAEDSTNDGSGSSSSSEQSGVAININISNNSISVGGGSSTNDPDDPADQPDDDPQGDDPDSDGPDTDGPDDPVVGTVPPRGPGAGSQGDGPPAAPRRPGQVPSTPPPGTVPQVLSNALAQPGLDIASYGVAQPAAVDTARNEPALTELSRTGADIQQATLLGLMLLAAGLVTQAALRRWPQSA